MRDAISVLIEKMANFQKLRKTILYKNINQELTDSDVDHIIDWLYSPDSLEQRQKLEKLTVEGAYICSKKWTDKLVKEAKDRSDKEKTQRTIEKQLKDRVIYKCSDGFFVVKVETIEEFDLESIRMSNCVASLAYGQMVVYSLRDKDNKSIVNIGVKRKEVVDLKGKFNKKVKPEHLKYIKEFLFDFLKFKIENKVLINIYLYQDHTGKIYDLLNLEQELVIQTDVDLSHAFLKNIPNNLIVTGRYDLSHNLIEEIPSNFIAYSNLYLHHNQIKALPENFEVNSCSSFAYNKINTLPVFKHVYGCLDMSHNLIEELPASFNHECILVLENNPLKSIEKGFRQQGYLYLSDTFITFFPCKYKFKIIH